MTIKEFRNEDSVRCQWFDEHDNLKQADFPLKSIKLFEEPNQS